MVASELTLELARDNTVWALGRWANAAQRRQFDRAGVLTAVWDMTQDEDLSAIAPANFTHVLHAGVYRGEDGVELSDVVKANTRAVEALMGHCRLAEAFLFVSTVLVYSRVARDHEYKESDPTRGYAPWRPAYPAAKIAAEEAARDGAIRWTLPTIIARLNVAYGPCGRGGLPITHLRAMLAGQEIALPSKEGHRMNPIHTDDIARQVPLLWNAARVPARTVNWAGDEMITEAELLAYLAGLTRLRVRVRQPATAIGGAFGVDNSLRTQLIGPCRVGWREGVARTVRSHFPDAVA